MTEARKAKVSELAKKLHDLSEDQKMELVASCGGISTIEGRTLSLNNTCLILFQADGTIPTVVGGYRQWQREGRQVRKGERGSIIWVPSQAQSENEDEDPELRFYTVTVFDISQTEEKPE
jgi:hypothetical protein